MTTFQHHKAYRRMYKENELTLGLHMPLENYQYATPTMEKQVELTQLAETIWITSLWFRDVLLQDPSFGDPATGQIYDSAYLFDVSAQSNKRNCS